MPKMLRKTICIKLTVQRNVSPINTLCKGAFIRVLTVKVYKTDIFLGCIKFLRQVGETKIS